jgi:hypothetical protein
LETRSVSHNLEPSRERPLIMSMMQIILIVALIVLIGVYVVIKKKQQG